MKRLNHVNESRLEEGYTVTLGKEPALFAFLSRECSEVLYSTPYNQTVYFNNLDHEVPFNFSVRARRYVTRPSGKKLLLKPDSLWGFEIKKSQTNDSRHRTKQSVIQKLKVIITGLKQNRNRLPFATVNPLKPHVGVTYLRRHFILNSSPAIRVTVDSGLQYYLFSGSMTGVLLDKESQIRIEIKFPARMDKSVELEKIRSFLNAAQAVQPLSKKHHAYNAEYRHISKLFTDWPKNSDTEIEAKLSFPSHSQHFFTLLKEKIRLGQVPGFRIMPRYPYSWEYAADARYVNYKNTQIRINASATKATYKSDPKLVSDPFRVNCIVQRSEVTKKVPGALLRLPHLQRRRVRKTFMIQNIRSKMMYLLLIDRTITDGSRDSLFQFEVEAILTAPSTRQIEDSVRDISLITKFALSKFRFLKPNPITKYEWLKKRAAVKTT